MGVTRVLSNKYCSIACTKHLIYYFCFILTLTLSDTSYGEDKVTLVLDQIEDITIRVESGISLNSYAESLAQLKIDYKKASSDPNTVDNPLLSDRMKQVLKYMDDYAMAWRWMDIDGYRVIGKPPAYVGSNVCTVSTQYYGTLYDIPCVKSKIMDKLKETIGSAKSAHLNGW